MGETQPDHLPLVADLVGDVERFVARHWGRLPAHRSGATGLPPFGIADVESMLDTSVRSPSIRLVADGRPRPMSEWTTRVRLGGVDLDDVADGRKVGAAFRSGASIVLQGLHRTWPPLVRYARRLELEVSHPVQVNAYLTPPRSRGLGPHADAHDVFVVQTEGSKRWSVEGLGETTITTGDVLYVPAGVVHRAESLDDVSLHLTIGILRRTRRQLVERALRQVTALDEPLPLGFAHGRTDLEVVTRQSLNVAAAALVADDLDVAGVARAEIDRVGGRADGGDLVAVARSAALDLGWRLVWRRTNRVELDEVSATVRAGARWVRVPAAAIRAVLALRDGVTDRVADLPGLDPASRLVLARRLTREGIVDARPG